MCRRTGANRDVGEQRNIIQGTYNGNDIEGPDVSFFSKVIYNEDNLEYEYEDQFYDNDIVFLNNTIIVKTEDKSGINLMGGLGHSIRYWFNDENDFNFIDIDMK